MRSAFFAVAAAGVALATNEAQFQKDTEPQGYGVVTQISDGQIQAPATYAESSSTAAAVETTPSAPAYSASASSSEAAPVETTPSASAYSAPASSSVASAVVPTPTNVTTAPVAPVYSSVPVAANSSAPYPTTGASNTTTLTTSLSSASASSSEAGAVTGTSTTSTGAATQTGGAMALEISAVGAIAAGIFAFFV